MMLKGKFTAYTKMMLKIDKPPFYKVKKGQTVRSIAAAFGLPPTLLVSTNRLEREAEEGMILRIPKQDGNLYTTQVGDSKKLLSGSDENYEKRNGTTLCYPGLTVFV